MTFSIATNPTHGTLSGFNPATGEVTYTPLPNYASLDRQLTFTVNDGTYRECSCDCLYNCREPGSDCQRTECNCYWKYSQVDYTDSIYPNNDPLTFSIATNPTHGTLSGFNPATGAGNLYSGELCGPDSFTFTVNDGTTESAPATVSITVENQAPTANAQSVTVTGNTPKLITLTGTDPNNDPLTFSIATNPTHGTLSGFNPATGEVTYTPVRQLRGS